MGHSLHCSIQISAVHSFREDPLVIFPSGIGGSIDIGIHDLSVILKVQSPLHPLPCEECVFRISCPVCRDIVPVPEAGFGGIALFLQDDPDPIPHTYRLQDTAEPREGDLHEGLVCLFLQVYPLLLAFVVTDDEVGKAPLFHRPADIVGILVECIPQESVTLS